MGPDVESFSPGQTVLVPWQISCGVCGMCGRGFTTSCERTPHRAGFGFGADGGSYGGALADLLRVPYADAMLVNLPNAVDPRRFQPLQTI